MYTVLSRSNGHVDSGNLLKTSEYTNMADIAKEWGGVSDISYQMTMCGMTIRKYWRLIRKMLYTRLIYLHKTRHSVRRTSLYPCLTSCST